MSLLSIWSGTAQTSNGSCGHSAIHSPLMEHNSVAGHGLGSRMHPLPGFQKLLVDSRKCRVVGGRMAEIYKSVPFLSIHPVMDA